MQNPWLYLPQHSPYVLEIDRASLNLCAGQNINLHSIPEPFIGDPDLAKVILLNLNPGDSPDDPKAHQNHKLRATMIQNLRHELADHPFYPLNPEFLWSPVAKWWTQRLSALINAVPLDRAVLAQRLCVVEWFPYHSQKAGLCVCPSQQYSFHLAKRSLGKKLIVRMRAKTQWTTVDPRFAGPSLKNPQCAYVTPGNTENGLFNKIIKALLDP
jgi:hypothetical protein